MAEHPKQPPERLEGQVQRSDTAAFEELVDRVVELEQRADISRLEARFPKSALRDTQEGHLHKRVGRLNVRRPRELTIASGLVDMTRGYHTIDTESDAASDNLAAIRNGRAGEMLMIQPDNDARSIVVKHNDTGEGTAGNRIFLNQGSDITLDGIEDMLPLFYDPAADSANGAWRDSPPAVGGPWTCRDYLVDGDYTGTEGAVISTANTTHTFKIFSTVEGATDDGIANLSRAFSVEICGGDRYLEDLEIPDHSHEIHLYGSGIDATIIGGNTVASHSIKGADVWLHDLMLDGPAGGYSLTSGAGENCEVHARNVRFNKRMAGDHAGSEFYDCIWPQGIQFEAGDTPSTVLIVGGVLSSATGLDLAVATGIKANWTVLGLRMNTGATLKLRNVPNSHFNIHFETDGGSLNDQVVFSDADSAGVELDCRFAAVGDGGQVISVEAGREIHNLQVRGIAQYGTGIGNNATRWFDNDGIVVGSHFDVSFRRNGSGNRLEDDITGPSFEGDFRECKFTLTPTDVEVLTDGSSVGNVVDAGTIQSGSVGIVSATSIIHDADGDTKVDTEESADEDIIRMDAGGLEVFTLGNAGQLALPVQGSGAGLLLGGEGHLYYDTVGDVTNLFGGTNAAADLHLHAGSHGTPTGTVSVEDAAQFDAFPFSSFKDGVEIAKATGDILRLSGVSLTQGLSLINDDSETAKFLMDSAASYGPLTIQTSNGHIILDATPLADYFIQLKGGYIDLVLDGLSSNFLISASAGGHPLIRFDGTGAPGPTMDYMGYHRTDNILHFGTQASGLDPAGGGPLSLNFSSIQLIVAHVIPLSDTQYDLGSSSKQFRDIYLSGTVRSGSAATSIQVGGSINVGADAAANASSSIDLTHTNKALLLNRLTTTQRNALTAVNGHALYNSTTNKFQMYENGSWVDWDAAHTAASHSDQSATGAELETLTDGSNADTLHTHSISGFGSASTVTAIKTSDETVNNSDTLQNDDDLLFAIGANETWNFRITAYIAIKAASDFKWKITVPAAATGVYWRKFYVEGVDDLARNEMKRSLGDTETELTGVANENWVLVIEGTIVNNSTAGNVTLQWAQNTAVAEDTKMLTNSYIDAYNVAGGTVVHGPSVHTEFANWKVLYTDGSGDEQELALGADGTFLQANGASSVPSFAALVVADIPYDDATSDPLIDADSAADGTEGSPARKDHVHPKHHAKYTDAEAVTAIEAEDPLDLAGVLNLAKNLTLTKGTSANIDANDEIVVPAVSWLYLTSAGATDNLDGIGAGTEGQFVILTVVAGKDITLVHNGTVTTGKKLMINGEANVTLDEDHDMAIAMYDATATVWNVLVPGAGGAAQSVELLDGSEHTDTAAGSVVRGDIITGQSATPKWTRLAAKTAGAVVGGDGTDVVATVPKRTIMLSAQGGTPSTTSGCAPPVAVEAGTNDVDYWVLDFASDADEYAFWGPIAMPANYDGGVLTAIFYWTTTATDADGVAWAIQLLSADDGDPIDTAWGTAVVVTDDAQSAAGDVLITAASGDITPGGTASTPEVLFARVYRDVSDANDDMTEDARLMAVKLLYTVDGISD